MPSVDLRHGSALGLELKGLCSQKEVSHDYYGD